MRTHTRQWGGSFFAAVLLSLAALAAGPRPIDQAIPTSQAVADGSYLFRTYCASCHGTSARGDGPLADSMRRRPANLTEILKRNEGVFSKELVYRIIDGRQKVRGHGGPDMPVWGDAFLRSMDVADEAAVARRITALVEYLEAIQVRNTQ